MSCYDHFGKQFPIYFLDTTMEQIKTYQKVFAHKLLRIAVASGLLLLAENGMARTGHEGWYQIEMIVFSRRDQTSDEYLRKDLRLSYPLTWDKLRDPTQIENPASAAAADAPTAVGTPTNGDTPTEAQLPNLASEPFWQLTSADKELNRQAQTLKNNPRYQLLFHNAWRQIITNRKAARSLLISGGDTFGDHQELEGSIKLSVATYLKIETNLWLTQFDTNLDQTVTTEWPALPARPDRAPHSTQTDSAFNANNIDMNLNFDSPSAENQPLWASEINSVVDNPIAAFIPKRIALMHEERDMRSREIHYIDSPLLGIIIKITPYAPPSNVEKAESITNATAE